MDFLRLTTDYQDPEARSLEIVERKGIGHPDTLADMLAEAVSVHYSRYCLEKFGMVLHHNVDKLYIGGGHFEINFGQSTMLEPVQVFVNGRMSNSFANEHLDLSEISRESILPLLLAVLPHLKENEVVINSNSTQHTKIPYWFSPRGRQDLPDSYMPMANDTSVCVSHWPMTVSERLAFELERYFWIMRDGVFVPKFDCYGQDVKVMVCRKERNIDITVCLPVISTAISSFVEYDQLIEKAEDELNDLAERIVEETMFSVSVKVNPYQRLYMLGTGSCIECGEEGIVGRGNSNAGIISVFRPHSMEAWAGKNPVYHTGRVLSFLTMNLAKALNKELGVKCTVMAMSKNNHSLVPPYLLLVETDRKVQQDRVQEIITLNFINVDYLRHLLLERQIK